MSDAPLKLTFQLIFVGCIMTIKAAIGIAKEVAKWRGRILYIVVSVSW
jgi:hypothetical protein